MNTVLVTGATGSLGRTAVSTLSSKGIKVRAAARSVAKAAFAAGVETVRFDYQDSATFEAAMKGVEGAVLIAPPLDPDFFTVTAIVRGSMAVEVNLSFITCPISSEPKL